MKYKMNPNKIKIDLELVSKFDAYIAKAIYIETGTTVQTGLIKSKEIAIKRAINLLAEEVYYECVINNNHNKGD